MDQLVFLQQFLTSSSVAPFSSSSRVYL
ncbi:hypothetical protein F383_38313 [Gossypium arboreum]|uniref:Uncharacterized protein n=1 Tax=Gossypium arboreum TaxID=29729 RepID=A0A0B0MF43_GOSAR|nr:hypothetical protein F383_38313 [Gossypium arboreum]